MSCPSQRGAVLPVVLALTGLIALALAQSGGAALVEHRALAHSLEAQRRRAELSDALGAVPLSPLTSGNWTSTDGRFAFQTRVIPPNRLEVLVRRNTEEWPLNLYALYALEATPGSARELLRHFERP